MPTSTTIAASHEDTLNEAGTKPVSIDKSKVKAVQDKGKGKAVVDEDMDDDDDDEEDDEEDEEDEEGDEEMDDLQDEEVDPSAIISAPRRRTQVDYSSKEAFEKAGLAPEQVAKDEEEAEADEYVEAEE